MLAMHRAFSYTNMRYKLNHRQRFFNYIELTGRYYRRLLNQGKFDTDIIKCLYLKDYDLYLLTDTDIRKIYIYIFKIIKQYLLVAN